MSKTSRNHSTIVGASLWSLVLVVIASVVLGAPRNSIASEVAIPDASTAEVSPEAEYYVKAYGVSIDRARAITTWMHEVSDVLDLLYLSNPDSYAGAEYFHSEPSKALLTGEVLLEVYLTKSAGSQSPFGDFPALDGARVELVVLPNAISADGQQQTAEAAVSGAPQGTRPDVAIDGSVTFVPIDEVTKAASCTSSNVQGGWLEGGRRLHTPIPTSCTSQATCTSGFTAWYDPGSPGGTTYQGILTSGHCFADLGIGTTEDSGSNLMYANTTDIFVSLRHFRSDYLPDDDVSFVRKKYSDAVALGRVYMGPSFGDWYNMNSVAAAPAPNGSILCMKSTAIGDIGPPGSVNHDNGVMCANVDDNVDFFGASTTQNWTQMKFCAGCASPDLGSSGGPWFNFDKAYGIMSGISNIGGFDYSWFERIEKALPALEGAHGGNFALYCGGLSPYLCG
jgi:hypothetical protein